MFGEGISKAGEIIDLGAELNIIKKSGSWYSYNDTKLDRDVMPPNNALPTILNWQTNCPT